MSRNNLYSGFVWKFHYWKLGQIITWTFPISYNLISTDTAATTFFPWLKKFLTLFHFKSNNQWYHTQPQNQNLNNLFYIACVSITLQLLAIQSLAIWGTNFYDKATGKMQNIWVAKRRNLMTRTWRLFLKWWREP